MNTSQNNSEFTPCFEIIERRNSHVHHVDFKPSLESAIECIEETIRTVMFLDDINFNPCKSQPGEIYTIGSKKIIFAIKWHASVSHEVVAKICLDHKRPFLKDNIKTSEILVCDLYSDRTGWMKMSDSLLPQFEKHLKNSNYLVGLSNAEFSQISSTNSLITSK